MNVFIINFLAYLAWFLIVYKKEKTITLYSCMILLIAIVAFAGVYTLMTGIYFDTFGTQNLSSIDSTPFILCFIGFVIFFNPLRYAKMENVEIPEFSSKNFQYLLIFWLILTTAYTILKATEASAAVAFGLDQVYEARHVDGEALSYMVYDNQIILKLRWIGGIVSNATCPVAMLYAMTNLIKREKISLSVYVLLLAFLPSFFHSIATGSRGSMFLSIFKVLFIVIFLKDFLQSNIKKIIWGLFASGVAVVLIYSIAITVARVGDTDALSSVLRYFGEPFPNMSFSYWEYVINHPMGERFFPDFIGSNATEGFSPGEIHEYWGNITNTPILNWKILYCDCYIEFGKLGGILFIIIYSILFGGYFKKHPVNIYNITVLFFYYELCDNSFTGYNGFSNIIITTFISIIVLNLILRFYCRRVQ